MDAKAILTDQTEEYYIPMLDQEQGLTQGNMAVLEYYFGDLLGIPKAKFEEIMYTILSDCLTVA